MNRELPHAFDDGVARRRERSLRAQNLQRLEDELLAAWDLGRNIVLAWSVHGHGVAILAVPHHLPAEILCAPPEEGPTSAGDKRTALLRVICGVKQLPADRMAALGTMLGIEPRQIKFRGRHAVDALDSATVEQMVRRYSVSYFEERAIFLVDIVGFSRLSPVVQMTQLNNMAYSLNAAYEMLLGHGLDIEFARTTTGDGFYVWSRRDGVEGNIQLYHLMHLFLAHNALELRRSELSIVPVVKCAFHVGAHYEFYQQDSLRPTRYNYVVGDVTVTLARIMEHAMPGQILVGDFLVTPPEICSPESRASPLGTIEFIERLQYGLDRLSGLVLAGRPLTAIRCYLTGRKNDINEYDVQPYRMTDKHGMAHMAYNAKVNIYCEDRPPIFLGLQHSFLNAQ